MQVRNFSNSNLVDLYRGWVYAAVDVSSDAMAALPKALLKSEIIKDEFIEHKNMEFLTPSLIKLITIFLKTLGVAYVYKHKAGNSIFALYVLKSQNVIEEV